MLSILETDYMITATRNRDFWRVGILTTAVLLVCMEVPITAQAADKNDYDVLAQKILEGGYYTFYTNL